jgi:hypothetical protein
MNRMLLTSMHVVGFFRVLIEKISFCANIGRVRNLPRSLASLLGGGKWL